jgi:CHAT domain
MLYQRKLQIPFLDPSPVHVLLRIFSSNGGYTADMSVDEGMFHRFRIGLTAHDVDELNQDLQQSIEGVATESREGNIDILSKLAQKGNYAFKRVFPVGIPRELISAVLKKGATIQFSSEDFFLPWELVYDGPLGKQYDPCSFWGMRHTISRAIIRDARPGALASPVIQSVCPHVGLIACNELQYVVTHEIPTLQELHRRGRILLSCLECLDVTQREQGLETFGRFLRGNTQIVHLACHAYEKDPLHLSCLYVSNDFPISIEDFVVREFAIEHHPFVMLNACLTGTISPLYTSNWASLFWEYGARGVLATEFRVPDSFAAAFMKELYKHFLSGKPIGVSLLTTRRHFWKRHQNLLGLAYALYSSPSVRLAKGT